MVDWLGQISLGLPALRSSALLLAWGVGWCLAVLISLRPSRRFTLLLLANFLTAWFISEAPLWYLFFLWCGAGVLMFEGALGDALGHWGLGLCALASLGLFVHVRHAQRVPKLAEEALREGFGPDYAKRLPPGFDPNMGFPRLRLWLALLLFDHRVKVLRDIPYVQGGDRRQKLDIYLPSGEVRGAPVVFQIHGGAWVTGHKAQQARPLMYSLAARGFVCVSINYRLSPCRRWPAQLLDAKRALAWTKQHIAEHGGDPHRVLVTGGSAGGQLSALLALTPNRAELQPGFEEVDTRVQAAVPFYGIYDVLDRHGVQPWRRLTRFFEWAVARRSVEDAPELFDLASPIVHVNPDAPPMLIVHGTHDNLAPVEVARLFAEKLRAASRAPVAYLELPYGQHMFETFYSLRTLYVLRAVYTFATLTVGSGHRDGARASDGSGAEQSPEVGTPGREA